MNERDRIELLMKCYELSPSQFADRTGIQRASVSHILSGRNKPSLEVMLKIFDAFPGIDMKWLMTGIGEEPVNEADQPASQNTLFPDDNALRSSVHKNEVQQEVAAVMPLVQQTALQHRQHQSKPQRKLPQSRQQAPSQQQTRRIKEVRIYYTDGTYEILLPEKQ